jgi:hypothetical protein
MPRPLILVAALALTACEWSGYGYVNARSSAVKVVREDYGKKSTFTLAAQHRQSPLIHDKVPDVVSFFDLRGRKLGSVSARTELVPFGAPVILIDEQGVHYTKLSAWPQLPFQEPALPRPE